MSDDGTVFVTQNFSLLTEVTPGGDPAVIYADEGQREIGGVSVTGDVVTFTATAQGGRRTPGSGTHTPDGEGLGAGRDREHLGLREGLYNPDGGRTYGIRGLSKSCTKAIPKEIRPFVAAYKGIRGLAPLRDDDRGWQ